MKNALKQIEATETATATSATSHTLQKLDKICKKTRYVWQSLLCCNAKWNQKMCPNRRWLCWNKKFAVDYSFSITRTRTHTALHKYTHYGLIYGFTQKLILGAIHAHRLTQKYKLKCQWLITFLMLWLSCISESDIIYYDSFKTFVDWCSTQRPNR